jgi:hypothetical protein
MERIATLLQTPDHWRSKEDKLLKSQKLRTGFIAQEVAQVAEEIGYEFDGIHKPENEKGYYGLAYSSFVVPLIKAVQEQQLMIQNLENRVQQLEEIVQKQQEFINQLEREGNS